MYRTKVWVLAVAFATAGLVLAPPAAAAAADKKADKKKNKANAKKADESAALFKKLDTDNDGKLSPTEFAKLAEAQKAAMPEKAKKKPAKAAKANKVAKAGKKANKNKNKAASQATDLFTKLDTNKDGFLSPDEFKKLGEVQTAAKTAKKANKPKKAKK